MYKGCITRILETEIPDLLLVAQALQINGILGAVRIPIPFSSQHVNPRPCRTSCVSSTPSSPSPTPVEEEEEEEEEEGDDDVFVDESAVDLSPFNR